MDFIVSLVRLFETSLLSTWMVFAGYLLVLAVAAARARKRQAGLVTRQSSAVSTRRRFAIIIPAHNEEAGIAATIEKLELLDYPRERFDIIVIADNCEDRTADLARRAGARVAERRNEKQRGKGYALAWAFDVLSRSNPSHDAYVILDADSVASPGILEAMNRLLEEGYEAIQVYDAVMNPGETWTTALRYASFASYSYTRPLGRTTLGFSAKLQGTGMCLAASLLRRHPWRSFGLAEDIDYSSELAAAGIPIGFVAHEAVRSQMPQSLEQMAPQIKRWEHGRWQNLRRHVPRLLAIALKERSPQKAEAVLDLTVPPLSFMIAVPALMLAWNLTVLALLRSPGFFPSVMSFFWATVLAAATAHLIIALLLAGAPMSVYLALLRAPLYLIRLAKINLDCLLGRSQKGWERSPRGCSPRGCSPQGCSPGRSEPKEG